MIQKSICAALFLSAFCVTSASAEDLTNPACKFLDTNCTEQQDHTVKCDGRTWTAAQIQQKKAILVPSWPNKCLNAEPPFNTEVREKNERRRYGVQ
ncbi:MAG: hypothetical protein H7839_01930 [Magnetococcus sp. YQC-5]